MVRRRLPKFGHLRGPIAAALFAAIFSVWCGTASAQTLGLTPLSRTQSTKADDIAADPSVSADGQRIAFWSTVSDLVAGDTNGASDVFVYDLPTSNLRRVSVTASGEQGRSNSVSPVIAGNGRYVVFESLSGNLTGALDGARVLLRKDLITGALEIVSPLTIPNVTAISASQASVSTDGQIIAFTIQVSNQQGGTFVTIAVRDMVSGAVTFPVTGLGGVSPDSFSFVPSLSGDGRQLVFHSYATNLIARAGLGGGAASIYRVDRQTGLIDLVSKTPDGTPANGTSTNPTISANGRMVSFESTATNLAAVYPGTRNFFRVDLTTGEVRLISADVTGAAAYDPVPNNLFRRTSALSIDGSTIAFESLANNFGSLDDNGAVDVYVKDMNSGAVRAAACSAKGEKSLISGSGSPSLSADSTLIAFNAGALAAQAPLGGGVFIASSQRCVPPTRPAIDNGWWTIDGRPGSGVFVETRPDGNVMFLGIAGFDSIGGASWQFATLTRGSVTSSDYFGSLLQSTANPGGPTQLGGLTIRPSAIGQAALTLPVTLGGTTLTLRRFPLASPQLPADPRIRLQTGWWYAPSSPGIGIPVEIQGQQIFLGLLSTPATSMPMWSYVLAPISTTGMSGQLSVPGGGTSLGGSSNSGLRVISQSPVSLGQFNGDSARLTLEAGSLDLSRFNLF